jgi:hypothetical protein
VFSSINNISHSQSWTILTEVESLITEQSLIGISTIHASGDRVFFSSLKSDFSTGLYYSDDGGNTWTESESTDKSSNYSLFSNDEDSIIYAWGTSLFGEKQIKKSSDNGANWGIIEVSSTKRRNPS